MKSILISIRPEWVAKILNGEKTIEVRKKFPKGYVGWVYIYATKQGILAKIKNVWRYIKGKNYNPYFGYQGKVVARFWVDKVGWFSKEIFGTYEEPFTYNQDDLLKKSCLTEKELDIYLQGKNGYAIHIAKLEIFDKPKELKDFKAYIGAREISVKKYSTKEIIIAYGKPLKSLTRAPQSWCYVEV